MQRGSFAVLALLMTTAVFGQASSSRDAQSQIVESHSQLTFDVAAIHPSPPDATGGIIRPLPSGSGYEVENMTAKTMMAAMYRIPERRIEGGPEWFGSERFNVEARADHEGYSIDELHAMFKNLLTERFGLRVHVDTRDVPVYILTLAKGGPKMKDDGPRGDLNIPMSRLGPGQWVGRKVPVLYLCWFLGQVSPNDMRPVIDETGLKDVYDFELSYGPDLPPGAQADNLSPEMRNRPALREALEEQLGLVLKPAKGPVAYYVIDHVEQPSAN
jgi:uncharacterized protein (TIGR03435 family)